MPDSNAMLTSLIDVHESFRAPVVRDLSDDDLIGLQKQLAEVRRRVDAASAAIAAAVADRSHHELGHSGLAQRLGARTPQRLVQRLTGSTAREAAALVRAGSLMDDAALAEAGADADGLAPAETRRPSTPWLAAVSEALSCARLSVEQASVIRSGLGEPDDAEHTTVGVTVEHLTRAASQLVAEAPLMTVEQLAVRARNARALLDLDADASRVEGHERALRDRRYLYLNRQADGMTRLSGLLDPESAALVRAAVDSATSPRRSGPRFVSADESDRETRVAEVVRDERTSEQLALDALVEIIRLGGAVAPTDVVGGRAPAVQVIVAERDLRTGIGIARIEGQTEPVSIATAERHVCESGILPVIVDDHGDVLNLGREARMFSRRQRLALAARDGGCRFPGCDRPPAWTEAHHMVPWSQGGRTDINDGVLLCRHHHLLLHNNGWTFTRVDHELAVIPPPDLDSQQRPIPAPTKSPTVERALRGAG